MKNYAISADSVFIPRSVLKKRGNLRKVKTTI